jgi:hypothetical protein
MEDKRIVAEDILVDIDVAREDLALLSLRHTGHCAMSSKNLSEIHAPMRSSAAGAKVSSI